MPLLLCTHEKGNHPRRNPKPWREGACCENESTTTQSLRSQSRAGTVGQKGSDKGVMSESNGNPNIQVEITAASEFYCFRLLLYPSKMPRDPHIPNGPDEEPVEIMLHGRSLVDLIHKCSLALCDWQAANTDYLLKKLGAR